MKKQLIILSIMILVTANCFCQKDSIVSNISFTSYLSANSYPVGVKNTVSNNCVFADYSGIPWTNEQFGANVVLHSKEYGSANVGLVFRQHKINMGIFEERVYSLYPGYDIIKNDFNKVNYMAFRMGYSYPFKIWRIEIEPIVFATFSIYNDNKNNYQNILLKEQGNNNYITFNYQQLYRNGYADLFPSIKLTYNISNKWDFYMMVDYTSIRISSEYEVIKTETKKEPEFYYFTIFDYSKCITVNFGLSYNLFIRRI
ncbi:MAG: hypothetical protein CVU05_04275 [Bacteroidetes bacterium HGW-Bacteroidetes-21]|nr:MAG: hypothetical protein CVU05_04275 [Bacteroidetes bacterium HGW-Bacteroidetes-21]